MSQGNILVVDDDVHIRSFVGALLEDEGYVVRLAANGIEALDAVHAEMPDLVLMDLMMPEMDGWTCCERMKNERPIPAPPIIAMTASRDPLSRPLYADGLVEKPFHIDQLLERIREHLAQGEPDRTAAVSTAPPEGRLIAVVSDDTRMAKLIISNLRMRGHEVLHLETETETASLIGTAAPALLILDADRPDTPGWEAIEALAASPALAQIPVILLTNAETLRQDAARVRAAVHIQKPFAVNQLLQSVTDLLGT